MIFYHHLEILDSLFLVLDDRIRSSASSGFITNRKQSVCCPGPEDSTIPNTFLPFFLEIDNDKTNTFLRLRIQPLVQHSTMLATGGDSGITYENCNQCHLVSRKLENSSLPYASQKNGLALSLSLLEYPPIGPLATNPQLGASLYGREYHDFSYTVWEERFGSDICRID
jgi:hypothetical protein